VELFSEMGIKHLCICEVRWIESPVWGYLVDARGELEMVRTHGSIGEEGRYFLFRLGITDRPQGDGSRFPPTAGVEFALLAKGVDENGQPKWYPPANLTEVIAHRLRGDPRGERDYKFQLVYFVNYFHDRCKSKVVMS
jgi:hypothetical protein